jgi:hypothetical protein
MRSSSAIDPAAGFGDGRSVSEPDPELIAGLDRLAGEWAALAGPVDIRPARSEAERQAYYRLRFDTVLERGWATAGDLPLGLEQDGFDARALHLVGWDGDEAAAGARIVFPAPGLRLPTEDFFRVTFEPAGRVANVDRMLVAKGHRDRTSQLFRALLGRCWQELRQREIFVWAGIHTKIMIRYYRKLGFDVQVLAGPRTHWGEPRYAIRFEPKQAVIAIGGEPGRWRAEFVRRHQGAASSGDPG